MSMHEIAEAQAFVGLIVDLEKSGRVCSVEGFKQFDGKLFFVIRQGRKLFQHSFGSFVQPNPSQNI